jgi:Na+-driven multidrug efflux pump
VISNTKYFFSEPYNKYYMARKRKIETGLVEGKLSSSIWKLATPMLIGGALEDLFSMVDLFFVGRLGHIQVAAIAISGTIVAILMMLIQGIAVGTLSFVSRFTGEKNYEMADKILGQTFILSIIGGTEKVRSEIVDKKNHLLKVFYPSFFL